MDGRGVSVEGMLWTESGCMVPIFCCVFIKAQEVRVDVVIVVLGVGFGRAGRAGWVGRGVGRRAWPCWAR